VETLSSVVADDDVAAVVAAVVVAVVVDVVVDIVVVDDVAHAVDGMAHADAAVAAVVAAAAGAAGAAGAAAGGAVSFVSPFRASLVFVFLLSFHELLDFCAILSTCFLL